MIIQATADRHLFLSKQTISCQTLRLGTLDSLSDKVLDCSITDCKIEMVNPEALMLFGCRFIKCSFNSGKKISLDARFCSNYWEDCTFFGRYVGTQFGLWFEDRDGPCPWGNIALKGCDFSQATLEGCAFWKLDIESTKFPTWPSFTIIHPSENMARWRQGVLPSMTRLFIYPDDDESIDAIAFNWPWVAKKYELRDDPEQAKATLQKLNFVRL